MEEKKVIRISVRNLVEFILRSGDITGGQGGLGDREAMQAGTRIHQKIQKKRGPSYQAEVPVSYKKEYDHFILKIEGRADGVLTEPDGVTIEEIKGTNQDLERISEPVPVHLAQAKCYAWILGREKELEKVHVLMTYCRLESEENRGFGMQLQKEDLRKETSNRRIRHFYLPYQVAELEPWFAELLDSYALWLEFQYQWQKKRDASMQGLEFPFPYREGQRKMVSGVYRTILRKKELFVQAPTGVGKTMSAVFPAVRAIGEGHGEKLFYLTAKTITRTVAEEAIEILKEEGLQFKAITLTAKEKMCVLDEPECDPEHCPRAKGHFDRVNQAVYEMLTEGSCYTREAILAQAEKWQVCPHEMQLDVASWTDAVICDYNYVFDPTVRLKRFFSEGNKGDYLFLIDEAHNLVERGREMFSAVLVKEDIMELKRILRPLGMGKGLEKALNRCNHQLLIYKRECEACAELKSISPLIPLMDNLMNELERYLEEYPKSEVRKNVLDFYFQVRNFTAIYELMDENYLIYSSYLDNGNFFVKLLCVNPAANLQACINQGRSAVFFSATLLPIQYYKKMFSTHTDDYAIYVDSPFARENRALLVGTGASTRYTRRGREEYVRIASYISQVVREKRGNYMVFFPSYRLMNDVYEVYEDLFACDGTEVLLQGSSMTEPEREAFLEAFSMENSKTLVGFCIMGGIFSEGIDLDGEKLIGAVVVGTGIPQVGPERELLKTYFERNGENGFDYAYRYPGMNKVQQAAGRVIRTADDRGVILLLDDRFAQRENRVLFPKEWEGCRYCSIEGTGELVREFWAKPEEKGETNELPGDQCENDRQMD